MAVSWNERYLPGVLTVVAGLLVVIIIELALLISPGLPTANAQIPDSGLQRKELVGAVERTNAKLDAIREALRTQVFKVEVVNAESDRRPAPPTRPKSPSSARPSAAKSAGGNGP